MLMTMGDVSAIGFTTTNSQRYVVIRKAACRVPRRLQRVGGQRILVGSQIHARDDGDTTDPPHRVYFERRESLQGWV